MLLDHLEQRISPLELQVPAGVTVHLVQIGSPKAPGPASNPKTDERLELLSRTERDKAARFVRPALRGRYLSARAALRLLLARHLNGSPAKLRFEETDKGRPFLTDHKLDFNLSHSGDLALIAIGTGGQRIGVDLELKREMRDLDQLARRVLTPREIEGLTSEAGDQLGAFFRYWTCKEAYLKALGTGLHTDMRQIELQLDPEHKHRFFRVPGPSPAFSLEITEAPGHHACLVTLNAGQMHIGA